LSQLSSHTSTYSYSLIGLTLIALLTLIACEQKNSRKQTTGEGVNTEKDGSDTGDGSGDADGTAAGDDGGNTTGDDGSTGSDDDGGTSTGDDDGTTGGDDDGGSTTGGDDGGNVQTTHTYFNFAKEVIDRECASCHGSPPSGNAPDSFRLDSYELKDNIVGIVTKRDAILASIKDGSMPPAASSNLTADEKDKLINWLEGGAPKGSANPDLAITVTAPPADGASANASFDLRVEISNAANGATWSAW